MQIDRPRFARTAIALQMNLRLEEVGLAGFSGEIGCEPLTGNALQIRLRTGAEVILAGVDREEKVGTAAVRSDPGAVKPDANGGNTERPGGVVKNFNDIDEGLAGLGIGRRQLAIVVLDLEFEISWPAGIAGSGRRHLVLGARRILQQTESGKNQNEQYGFHNTPLAHRSEGAGGSVRKMF